jgi:P-type Ca2+ transporter type 2C
MKDFKEWQVAENSSFWWTQSNEEVCRAIGGDLRKGLSNDEAEKRVQKFGFNQLPEPKRISPLTLFLRQFQSFIVWVLLIAVIIAGFLGEWIDSIAIGAIVILNAALGFFQEFRAEKSLAALRKMAVTLSKVIRDGKLVSIPSQKIVPGDLILLEAGDRIPADGRIVQSSSLATEEAALTGESVPVHKITAPIKKESLPLGDKKNMGFSGTTVASGKGYLIVTATGLQTELGQIAALLQQGSEEPTPLQIKLEELGHKLVWICLGIVAIIFALGAYRGAPLIDNLLISLSLAVAAIPEGLPAIVTIALSVGVHRMVKRNALIRRLPSVETLGCTTVICTDKTGTLTQNEMTVRSIWVNDTIIDVTGIGYIPEGDFEINHLRFNPQDIPELILALKIGALCNNASLTQNPHEQNVWSIVGDPTEGALLSAAGKAHLFKHDLEEQSPIIEEIPFDSERKRMSIARRTPKGAMLFIKGAPDEVLAHSSKILHHGKEELLDTRHKAKIIKANNYLAGQAYRILAVAFRPLQEGEEIDVDAEEGLIFVGLFAMMDPPRPEVKIALETCKRAGITPVMITGDHLETALAVGKELDFMREGSQAITGEALDQMDDNTLQNNVQNIAIYARTSPAHKLRIVRAWKALGAVVAMTGDGVNDAPAIKEADIGVAMGITGTDVTKEASDMVILDDDFATIVNAVQEGRGIYDNICKFVKYLLYSNIAELFIIFFVMLIGFHDLQGNLFVALTPLQLLWLNLVTDGFPAIALGLDSTDPMVMNRPPRKTQENILSLRIAWQVLFIGLSIAGGALVSCYYGLLQSGRLAQTMTCTTLVVLEMIKAQMVRAQYNMSLFSNPFILFALASSLILQLLIVYVPFLQTVFGTTALTLTEWGVIALVVTVVGIIINGIYWLFRKAQP